MWLLNGKRASSNESILFLELLLVVFIFFLDNNSVDIDEEGAYDHKNGSETYDTR